MVLVIVGIGAITVVSFVLGWGLMAVAEVGGRDRTVQGRAAPVARLGGAERARVPRSEPPAPARRHAAHDERVAPNTLRRMDATSPRRRRDPVSGQTPRVRVAAATSR